MSRYTISTRGQNLPGGVLSHRVKSGIALLRRDRAASLAEMALIIPILCLVLFGLIDFGRAYYLGIEVTNAAYAGAAYGAVNSTDIQGMESAATADAANVPNMTATATYGCECSDGTNQVSLCSTTPSCPNNVINYVTVTTSASYKPIFPWPGLPSTLPLAGTATMRASQ